MPEGTLFGVLHPYRLLATVPRAPSLMITCLLGRLHMPAIPLVMTFLIVDWTGSYTTGGVLGAALTVGQGIAGPLRGRAADRSSAPKLLVITGICYAMGLCALAGLAGPLDADLWWLILPVAFATGLATPPVPQIGRAIWPRIAEPPARNAAYAVEATMQEMLFIVAPIAAATVVAIYGPVAATLTCAGWAFAGPTLFAWVLWRAGLRKAPASAGPGGQRRAATLLRAPGFVRLMAFGTLFAGGLIGTDLALVGWARDRGEPGLAGALAAVWALGSLIGGLALGASMRPPRLWLRAALATVGVAVLVPVLPPISNPGSPWLVSVVLLLGGAAIAPTLATANGKVGELAPADRRTEAFGWFSTAITTGGVIASPLVGGMLDIAGPAAAVGAIGGLMAVATTVVGHHSLSASRPVPEAEQSVGT